MIKVCATCGILFNTKTSAKRCLACRYEHLAACWREQARRYYQAHREQCLERTKRWQATHSEKVREYKRKAYIKSKLKVLKGET